MQSLKISCKQCCQDLQSVYLKYGLEHIDVGLICANLKGVHWKTGSVLSISDTHTYLILITATSGGLSPWLIEETCQKFPKPFRATRFPCRK